MDRHVATRRLRRLADTAGIRITRAHPHAPPHIRHNHAGCGRGLAGCPDRRQARRSAHHKCATTEPARTSTATRTTSSPPTWPPAHDQGQRLLWLRRRRRPALPKVVRLTKRGEPIYTRIATSALVIAPQFSRNTTHSGARLEKLSALLGSPNTDGGDITLALVQRTGVCCVPAMTVVSAR